MTSDLKQHIADNIEARICDYEESVIKSSSILEARAYEQCISECLKQLVTLQNLKEE